MIRREEDGTLRVPFSILNPELQIGGMTAVRPGDGRYEEAWAYFQYQEDPDVYPNPAEEPFAVARSWVLGLESGESTARYLAAKLLLTRSQQTEVVERELRAVEADPEALEELAGYCRREGERVRTVLSEVLGVIGSLRAEGEEAVAAAYGEETVRGLELRSEEAEGVERRGGRWKPALMGGGAVVVTGLLAAGAVLWRRRGKTGVRPSAPT